ncbi:DUF1450 domain-containing protein [Virgibacillus sp. 6R]|uniref:DUF1450 domain-containing protein n=1 Tax=Metabacillus sp. 22489 TaxID=3453928 RepID=UPI00119F532E
MKKLFSKQTKTKISFCTNNLDRFYSDADFSTFNTFLNDKRIEYKEYECQSKCKECKAAPYAVIDGEFVSADSPDELLKSMKSMIRDK